MYDFDAILKHAVAFHIIQYLCMQIEGFGLHKFFSLPAPGRSFFLLQTLICSAKGQIIPEGLFDTFKFF